MVCSLMGHHAEVQYQCIYTSHHCTALRDRYKCSPYENMGEWFRTTVGVMNGYLLSPTLFNIFLERIMCDALEEHGGTVNIGRRTTTNLQLADYIDALAKEIQETEALVETFDKTCIRYKMEISAEKIKLKTNRVYGIQREIKVK